MCSIRVALIGFGGYGQVHCRALAQLKAEGLACLQAVAEINQTAHAEQLALLANQGVSIYADWQEMLSTGSFDMVAIAAPLHLHRDMVLATLAHSYPVLCEKPAAVSVQDVIAMTSAAADAGVPCAIGYQLLTSRAIQKLKQITAEGALGSILRISGIGLVKRTDAYYQRSAWAGKFMVGQKLVLDGPMDNALAHMLNNMLYIASPEPGKLAHPLLVRAAMYRSQPLPEMEDTATVWLKTAEGPEVVFLATYNNTKNEPHYYKVEGTAGVAVIKEGSLIIEKNGKQELIMEDGLDGSTVALYRNFIAAQAGKATLLSCVEESVKLARAQNGAYMSSGRIHLIGAEHFRRYPDEGAMATANDNLKDLFYHCIEHNILPADTTPPWTASINTVNVANLQNYTPASPNVM